MERDIFYKVTFANPEEDIKNKCKQIIECCNYRLSINMKQEEQKGFMDYIKMKFKETSLDPKSRINEF